jgi:hypothetical protein
MNVDRIPIAARANKETPKAVEPEFFCRDGTGLANGVA